MMNNNVDGVLSHRYRFRIETNYMKLLDDDGINAQLAILFFNLKKIV